MEFYLKFSTLKNSNIHISLFANVTKIACAVSVFSDHGIQNFIDKLLPLISLVDGFPSGIYQLLFDDLHLCRRNLAVIVFGG